jgi:hypothetical protein
VQKCPLNRCDTLNSIQQWNHPHPHTNPNPPLFCLYISHHKNVE